VEEAAKMPAEEDALSSVSSHAGLQIRNSMAVIQSLVDPYLAAAKEAEVCCVAMRLDEIVGIMHSRVGRGVRVAQLESPTRRLKLGDDLLGLAPPSPFTATGSDAPNSFQALPVARPRLSKAVSMSSLTNTLMDRNRPPHFFTDGSTLFDEPHPSPSPSVTFSDLVSVSYVGGPEYSPHNQTQPLIESSDEGGSPTRGRQVLSKFAKIVPLPVTNRSWKEAATQVFNQIDKNKDGFLDRDEVKQALLRLGEVDERFRFIKEPTTYAGSLVDAGDQDGDDKIDKSEFIKMVRSGALNGSKKDDDKQKKAPRALALDRSSRFASSLFLAPRDKNLETLTIGNDKWLLHPKSLGHLLWGGLISLLIFVIMITMPLSFGWQEFGDSLVVYNTMVDFIFMLDIVKNLFTGSVDKDDNIIMDGSRIRREYLAGSFILDAISCVPLDLIFFLVSARLCRKIVTYIGGNLYSRLCTLSCHRRSTWNLGRPKTPSSY